MKFFLTLAVLLTMSTISFAQSSDDEDEDDGVVVNLLNSALKALDEAADQESNSKDINSALEQNLLKIKRAKEEIEDQKSALRDNNSDNINWDTKNTNPVKYSKPKPTPAIKPSTDCRGCSVSAY